MTDHKIILLALAGAMMVVLPTVSAQNASIDWQGQDSEFGQIRAPFALSMEGERVPVEARIMLREYYEDQDSRFFMFGFLVENTPLDVQFDNIVRMDTGEDLPCIKREGTASTGIKCFVDLRDMPPLGVEIRMYGTIGSSKTGMHNLGAMVMAFDYLWANVKMTNGLFAQLYSGTQVNVADCTGKCGGLSGTGNPVAQIPAPGFVGVLGAGVVAAGLFALRRKQA